MLAYDVLYSLCFGYFAWYYPMVKINIHLLMEHSL